MKFGTSPSVEPVEGESRVEAFRRTLEQARLLRASGFDFLFLGQHYFASEEGEPLHPVAAVARLYAEAQPMEMACFCLLPFANPIDLAEQLQTLDVICEGRLIGVMGQGWRRNEFKGFGIDQHEAVARFREVLEIMRSLWTQERTTYHGKFYNLTDTPRVGHSARQPRPHLWGAANVDAGVRRAARMTDGWAIGSRLMASTVERQLREVLWPTAKAEGRTVEASMSRQLYIANTWDEAMRAAQPIVKAARRRLAIQGTADPTKMTDEQIAKERVLIGEPAMIVEEIQRYAEMGVTYTQVGFHPTRENGGQEAVNEKVRLFTEKVLPHFK